MNDYHTSYKKISNLNVTLELVRKQKEFVHGHCKRSRLRRYKVNQHIDFISNCSSIQEVISYFIKERDEVTETIKHIKMKRTSLVKKIESLLEKRKHLKDEIAFQKMKQLNEIMETES